MNKALSQSTSNISSLFLNLLSLSRRVFEAGWLYLPGSWIRIREIDVSGLSSKVGCPANTKPPASTTIPLQDAFPGAARTIMAPVSRRDLILAAIAVFIAWGYLTHWQPKLHYLPYAFIAGVLAALALLAWLTFTIAWDKDLRSGGEVDYGPRHVAFAAPERWKAEREALDKRNMYMMEPLYPASFMISDSIDVLIGLILRDFVKSWYGSISKSPTFVNEVDRAVRATMGEIRERILAVDMVETVVSRMIPLITDHLRASYEAERVVRGRKLSRNITDSEELDLAIAAKYKEGRLHPAASLAYSNTKPIQQQHLRSIVNRLLPKIMPANMSTSPAVNVLIKEIVACAVLSPVMQMLADPDTWNQLMEGYVSAHLRIMSQC
jgi:sorting nexin-25